MSSKRKVILCICITSMRITPIHLHNNQMTQHGYLWPEGNWLPSYKNSMESFFFLVEKDFICDCFSILIFSCQLRLYIVYLTVAITPIYKPNWICELQECFCFGWISMSQLWPSLDLFWNEVTDLAGTVYST